MADIVIANKLDLYQDEDKSKLNSYIKQHAQTGVEIVFSQQGEIALSLLEGAASSKVLTSHHHHHKTEEKPLTLDVPMPECGFIKAINEGEGFKSIGWRFSPRKVFIYSKLYALLAGLRVERMKAVFITDVGVFAYNLTSDTLTEVALDECMDSRIEIISESLNETLETELMACIMA